MTDKEYKVFSNKIKQMSKDICSSEEKAKEHLFKTGFYTKTGKLKKKFRD